MEHLIEHGPDDMATIFARAFELAIQIERDIFAGRAATSALQAGRAMPTATRPSASSPPQAWSRSDLMPQSYDQRVRTALSLADNKKLL